MNNHFLIYLLEASICQLFFYIVYFLLLKKETYFNLNRSYLLCSLVISLLIPTIQIKQKVAIDSVPTSIEVISAPIQTTTHFVENKIESSVDILSILMIIYLVVVVLVSTKFIYQFFRVMLFIKRGKISVVNRHYLICTNGQYPTSSFFNYILWDNTVSLSDKEIEQIIKHEMMHIKQLHTLDNLLMELMGIVFWFNPLVYLYNKQLKQIHEYVADKEVLSNKEFTNDEYKMLINKQVLNNIGFQLSNNFNMSNLKNRIAMTTKSRSGKLAMLKLSIALPIVALMMLSFSYSQETIIGGQQTNLIQNRGKHSLFFQGIYKGQNLKVHNPSSTQGSGYSVKNVVVNGTLMDSTKFQLLNNFEIDFKSMNFKEGDKLKVEIQYLNYDEVPHVQNLEAIQEAISLANTHARVAGNDFQDGKMSIEQLLVAGELEINSEKFVIQSFTMSVLLKTKDDQAGSYYDLSANSKVFTHDMRELIKKLKPGQKVLFESVQAQLFDGPDNYGSIVKLPGAVITIE